MAPRLVRQGWPVLIYERDVSQHKVLHSRKESARYCVAYRASTTCSCGAVYKICVHSGTEIVARDENVMAV